MTSSPYGGSLLLHPLLDDGMDALMSDETFARRMVEVEVALAAAEASVGVIPAEAAEEIERKAEGWTPPMASLRDAVERNGVPVAGLASALRAQVGGPAADWVHHGATSQDIMDTAGVLQLREGLEHLENGIRAVGRRLATLAAEHRATVMTARTLGQAALPTTFGYKAASWLASLVEHLDRLDELRERLLVVQLGGAVGTLAALGEDGPAVEAALARRLELGVAPCPWHTRRAAVAELAGWLSLVTGALGKMGQDVILLGQTEVDELRESDDPGRGASSTMPHKHNPVLAPRLVAAAEHNASLLASSHRALIQEHERGTHGTALEQLTLPPMLQCTAGALRNAGLLLAGLLVREDRMADNIAATRGALMAEAATLALAGEVGREEAAARVGAASVRSRDTGEHLMDVLAATESASVDWAGLRDESSYLGAAGEYIDRVLRQASHRDIETMTENRRGT